MNLLSKIAKMMRRTPAPTCEMEGAVAHVETQRREARLELEEALADFQEMRAQP